MARSWLVLAAWTLIGCSLDRSVSGVGDATIDSGRDAAVEDAYLDDAGDGGLPTDGGLDAGLDAHQPWLLDYATGTFTRASEASFLTRAPDGVGGFLSWAAPNTARIEDRGDGAGPLLLIEGARTNLVLDSRDLLAVGWPLGAAGITVMADAALGPDGATTADRLSSGIDGNSPGQVIAPSTELHTLSVWGRATVDMSIWTASFAFADQPNVPAWYVPVQSSMWTRRSDTVAPITHGYYFPIDSSIGRGTLDLLLDLHQIERGAFASSVIRTTGGAGTRDADVLSFAASQVPEGLRTEAGGFAQCSPVFDSGSVTLTDERWLLAIAGAEEGIRFKRDATGVHVEAVSAGVVRAQSASLTFSAHDVLGPIHWFPREGVVAVNGVRGPVGTPWTWPSGECRVGGVPGGDHEAFARLGRLAGD